MRQITREVQPVDQPEIEVEVHRLGNRYVAVSKDSLGHQILRNEFQYATTHLTHLGPSWLLDPQCLVPDEQRRLQRLFKGNGREAQVSLQGWHLYQYLFGDGRALRRHLKMLEAERAQAAPAVVQTTASHQCEGNGGATGVRMTLLFSPGTVSLGRLPWEYIFDGRQFPCLEGHLMMSRRPLDVATATTKPSGGPLRILCLAPSPADQAAFDAEEELGLIQAALAPLSADGSATMRLLPEPTLPALLETMREGSYDVVHYVGHGVYHLPQRQGYLCFEDDLGRSAMVSGLQLSRFAGAGAASSEGSPPQLFVVAACRHAQVGIFDAVQDVADELLHRGFPRVLGVPAPLRPTSKQAFYRAFYQGLAEGETTLASLRLGRWALRDADMGSDKASRRYDWGLPVLHERGPDVALKDPGVTDVSRTEGEVSEQTPWREPSPRPLVGRHRELQTSRKAMSGEAHILYILGNDGTGKHAFVSYLLDHLGMGPAASLKLDCREIPEPLSVLAEIAAFWRDHVPNAEVGADDLLRGNTTTTTDGARAAAHLLDSLLPPRERARQAQALMAHKHTLVLLENLDAWFEDEREVDGELKSDLLRDVLLGLLDQPSRTRFLFTASRRWRALSTIGSPEQREIRLPLLSERYAVQLMGALPTLKAMAPTLEDRRAVYQLIGGHPLMLHYLDRWLSFGNQVSTLAESLAEAGGSTEAMLSLLTRQLLEQLDPGEYRMLQALSILALPFNSDLLVSLTHVIAEQAEPLIARWSQLGLLRPSSRSAAGRTGWRVVSSARAGLLDRLSESEIKALHLRAADALGAPHFDAARRQTLSRTITTWSEERIAWLARDANGILGSWLRQDGDPDAKARLVEEAIAWHYHLLRAGETEAAAQVAQTLAPELNRQGQRDLSRRLLQQSLPAAKGRVVGQRLAALARLQLEEGPLSDALKVYQEIYESLEPGTETVQRTYVMLRIGHTHQRLGNLEEALAHYLAALRIIRRREKRENRPELTTEEAMISADGSPVDDAPSRMAAGEYEDGSTAEKTLTAEADCLAHLASVKRQLGNLREALVFSQASKEQYEALESTRGMAVSEHEQGLILKAMGRPESALERFVAGLRICRQAGDRQCAADNLKEIGQLFDRLGRTDMAIQVIEEAIEHYEYLRSPEHGEVLALLEELYTKRQSLPEAITRDRTTRHTPE